MDVQEEEINRKEEMKNNQYQQQRMHNSGGLVSQQQLLRWFFRSFQDKQFLDFLSRTKWDNDPKLQYIFQQMNKRFKRNPNIVLTINPNTKMIHNFTLMAELMKKEEQSEKQHHNYLIFFLGLLLKIINLGTNQQKDSKLKKKLFRNKKFLQSFFKITIRNPPLKLQILYYKVNQCIIGKKLTRPLKRLCMQTMIRNLQYIKNDQIGESIITQIFLLENSSKTTLFDANFIKKYNFLAAIQNIYIKNKENQNSCSTILKFYWEVRNQFPKLKITQHSNVYQKLQIRGKMKEQFIYFDEFKQDYRQYVCQYWEFISQGEMERILDHYMKELNQITLLTVNQRTIRSQWLYLFFLFDLLQDLISNERCQETVLRLIEKGFMQTLMKLIKSNLAVYLHQNALSQFSDTCFCYLRSHSPYIYINYLRYYQGQLRKLLSQSFLQREFLTKLVSPLIAQFNEPTFTFPQLQ